MLSVITLVDDTHSRNIFTKSVSYIVRFSWETESLGEAHLLQRNKCGTVLHNNLFLILQIDILTYLRRDPLSVANNNNNIDK